MKERPHAVTPRLTWAVAWLVVTLVFLAAAGGTALASTSPGGLVYDHANIFTADDLARLDETLQGLPFPFHVDVWRSIYDAPGTAGLTDEQAMEAASDRRLFDDFGGKGVLMTIALDERLVYFWVDAQGDVNSQFLKATGRPFSDFVQDPTDAFGARARDGDLVQGIVDAAGVIRARLASAPAPSGTSAGPRLQQPAPAPRPPRTAAALLILLVAVLGVTGILVLAYRNRYSRERAAAMELRNGFVDGLLELEKELQFARLYKGPETTAAVTGASAAIEQALAALREGEEERSAAELLGRRWRFPSALRHLTRAAGHFKQAGEAYGRAAAAWESVHVALQGWDQAAAAARVAAEQAAASVQTEQGRTGWTLDALSEQAEAARKLLARAEAARETDPVQAFRLAGEATEQFTSLQGIVAELERRVAQWHHQAGEIQTAADRVRAVRQSEGIRFVELSPEEVLVQAGAAHQGAGAHLQKGDPVAAVRELEAAAAHLAEANGIVDRHLNARAQNPVKADRLEAALPELADARAQSQRILAELQGSYTEDNWSDLASLPERLTALESALQRGLAEARSLSLPGEQRYLQAEEMLDGWLAELARLRQQVQALAARPHELEQLAADARSELAAVVGLLSQAEAQVRDEALVLPAELASALRALKGALDQARALERVRPAAARRLAQEAAQLGAGAQRLLSAVADLARQAAEARAEVERARAQAAAASQYRHYAGAGTAAQLEEALEQAGGALCAGRYADALARAALAMQLSHEMEQAYHAFRAEQERRRRQAEMARQMSHRHRSHGGGFGGGFGGGGSWGGGRRGSGGGGSWGGGSRGSGGGGRW